MEYTPITLLDNTYEVQEEAHKGGLEDILGIILPEDVQTMPTFPATVAGTINATEAGVTASGPFVFKTGKKATKIMCIIEKNSLEIKTSGRNAFTSDYKVSLQNTQENRGLYDKLCKLRFLAYLKETEGDGLILGRYNGTTTGYLAHVKADSYSEKSGEKFADERMIEFTLTASPFRPMTYNETFSFAAGV